MIFLLICSYLADLFFGDPEGFAHPVRGMGRLIKFLENRLRTNSAKWIERTKGIILTFVVVGISTYLAYLSIKLSRSFSPFLGSLVWVYLGYTTLSIKDLQVKVKAILRKTEKDSLVQARKELAKIVSRDTQNLSKDKIALATIESIAENTNDGIIAPLFYLILGGPILAIAYKSINTLDSMVGYKNERYLHFGWFSAKLDDIVNFIPARISGLLILISSVIARRKAPKQSQDGAFLLRQGFGGQLSLLAMTRSFKTMLRDGRKHPSPNSGVSIAAMAGALGIRLGGTWTYQGRFSVKPYLGEEKRVIQPSFINEALTISLTASFLMVSAGVIFKWLI